MDESLSELQVQEHLTPPLFTQTQDMDKDLPQLPTQDYSQEHLIPPTWFQTPAVDADLVE